MSFTVHSSLYPNFLHKDVACLFWSMKILGQSSDLQHSACAFLLLAERGSCAHTGGAPADPRDTHCEGLERLRCVTQSIKFTVFVPSAHSAAELSSRDQNPEDYIPQRQKEAHSVFAAQRKTQLVYFPVTLISPVPQDCLSRAVGVVLIFKYISLSQKSHWASQCPLNSEEDSTPSILPCCFTKQSISHRVI